MARKSSKVVVKNLNDIENEALEVQETVEEVVE